MDNMQYVQATLVLNVGSLCFYECSAVTFLFGKPTYYWKFKSAKEFFGPFVTLEAAGNDVNRYMTIPPQFSTPTPPPMPEAPVSNVVHIDFKSKRRL